MPRSIEQETIDVTPGKSNAKSSSEALYYHDVPPELIRRIAKRYTLGHKKRAPDKVRNLNWRTGIDDPAYVRDRLNHLVEHVLNFIEDGDKYDDNLAAIGWSAGFLMEVERHAPSVLRQVIGQCKLFGDSAKEEE